MSRWSPSRVPIVYQLAKSVGHSSMAIYQIVAPYLADPTNPCVARPRSRHLPDAEPHRPRTACPTLDLSADDRDVLREHPRAQPGLHGRVPREGDVHLPGARNVRPRLCAVLGQDHRHRAVGPGAATGWRSSKAGRSCSATTGSAPTPSATRCTSPGRTTSCSPSSPSSWGRRRWAIGCC